MSFMDTRFYKTTRKAHTCEYCERKIPAGEPRYAVAGIYESDFCSYTLCPWCNSHISDIETGGHGGTYEFETGGLRERVWDAMRGTECPRCGHDDNDVDIHTESDTATFTCGDDACAHKWDMGLAKLLGVDRKQKEDAE